MSCHVMLRVVQDEPFKLSHCTITVHMKQQNITFKQRKYYYVQTHQFKGLFWNFYDLFVSIICD